MSSACRRSSSVDTFVALLRFVGWLARHSGGLPGIRQSDFEGGHIREAEAFRDVGGFVVDGLGHFQGRDSIGLDPFHCSCFVLMSQVTRE